MSLQKIVAVLFMILFVSCSNNDSSELFNEEVNTSQFNLCGVNIENRDGTLAFESEEQMKELLANISSLSMPSSMLRSASVMTNLTQISTLKKNGFRSLYDVFVEAMSEAEFYYEKEGGYEEFKTKYSSLYFPEKGDDYSAYLPISDKNMAKIVDENGNVFINGEIVSLKDITSYEQLQDLGLTSPDDNSLRATTGTNGIAEEKTKSNKVWVKCKNDQDKNIPIVTVEVCFRKKNFLGMWYNHNSGTDVRLGNGVGLKLYEKSMIECFGFSSHDYKYARISYNGRDKIAVEQDVIINHHGTGKTLTLHVSYPLSIL